MVQVGSSLWILMDFEAGLVDLINVGFFLQVVYGF
jgi:hypothetical protein